MVDLKTQYQHIQEKIDSAVLNCIRSTAYINGPEVKAFADELATYLGVKHVIPCANGTDALQIAMMALDLQPDDEVIVPAFTYVATAEVIGLLRLKPVMVDVNHDDFNANIEAIRQAITPRTKAIVPVHLFGQCADMEAIMKIAEEHHLFVIEDNAQAIGADYTFSDGRVLKAGTIGHIGCTSFFPSKNLGAYGDGGAMFTNDDTIAAKLRLVANHGQSVQYYHDVIGVNSRLDSIQAAILRVKLRYLDTYCQARAKAATYYDEAFADLGGVVTPFRNSKSTHVFHQYTLKVEPQKRMLLKEHLASKGIPAMIYYPVPLYEQKAFAHWVPKDYHLPITHQLCQEVISLPMHTELSEDILATITEGVRSFYR